MQKTLKAIAALLCAGLLTQCGSSSESALTAFGTQYTAMTSSFEAASIMNAPSSRRRSTSASRAAIATPWDVTEYMNDPRCSGGDADPHCSSGAITLKEYMGITIDESSVRDNGSSISIFGRIKSAMMIGCAVMTVTAGGTGSYPANGTYAITLDAATKATVTANCDLGAHDLDDAPADPLSITVADATGVVYDKKFSFDFDADGTSDQDYYLSYTAGGALKIGEAEVNEHGISRTLLTYNFATQSGQAEYVSTKGGCTSNCHGEIIRIFWDATNNEAAIAQIVGQDSGSATRMYYYLAGKPNSTEDLGYSVFQSGNSTNAVGNACINRDTGAITSDNVTASGTACSIGVVDVTTPAPTMSAFFASSGTGTYMDAYWSSASTAMTSTTTVRFTSKTDIVTTSFLQ